MPCSQLFARVPQRPISRAGVTRLEVATILAIVLIACVIAMPFVIEMREAAREAQCAQNLKTIGIAMHTFAVSDPEERFLSGPLSPLTDGCPDLYGWPADMVLTGTGKAHELRCPANPIGATEVLSQLLQGDFRASTAPVDRRGKGFCHTLPVVGTPPAASLLRERAVTVAAKIRDLGINTNYASSWHAVWSEIVITEGEHNKHIHYTQPGPYDSRTPSLVGPLSRRVVNASVCVTSSIAVLGDSAPADRGRAAPVSVELGLGDPRLSVGRPVGAITGGGPVQAHSFTGRLVPFVEATRVENICFKMLPSPGSTLDDETAVALMPGTGTPGSHPTLVLLDTRHWAAVHRHRLNLLMADGSVRSVEDLNRDGYVNPGFHCPASCPPERFESQTGYMDGLVEINALEVHMSVMLSEPTPIPGCDFGE